MGAYHAEIIDKVGALVGGLTYGAKKEKGEEHFQKALKLAPASPIARIEYANGLVMMHGKKMVEEAGKLYAKAAAMRAARRHGEARRGDGEGGTRVKAVARRDTFRGEKHRSQRENH